MTEEQLSQAAQIESERDFNYPYIDFQSKDKNSPNGEHTGQALRGAFCQGYTQGFNTAHEEMEKRFLSETVNFWLINALRSLDKEKLQALTKSLAERCGLETKETEIK